MSNQAITTKDKPLKKDRNLCDHVPGGMALQTQTTA
jgi:hypothetical protein